MPKRASSLIDQLVQEIKGYRFSFVDEEELQMGVERVLQHVNAPYTREYRLSDKDRLDFFVPMEAISTKCTFVLIVLMKDVLVVNLKWV